MHPITEKIKSQTKNKPATAKLDKNKFRSIRINRIAEKLAERFERQRHIFEGIGKKRPFQKCHRVKNPKIRHLIGYDFETTSIKAGTPEPLYLTAFGRDFQYSSSISSLENLCTILTTYFLIPEFNGYRFVAWNGNKYDAYFIAAALLHDDRFILHPYMTKSKSLRGIKVISKDHIGCSWEFLDGISMTGIQKPLGDFLKTFAPNYLKLDAPDWETTQFNPKNKKHVEYAERDSEGLYHGLMKAQSILLEHFGVPLQPTIGKVGIRVFQQYIPNDVQIFDIPYAAGKAVRDHAMRGGFCFCNKKYEGPVWKYDINQAYAAAMRESNLPAGRCFYTKTESKYSKCGIYRVKAFNKNNKVPFYVTQIIGEEQIKVFALTDFEGWITTTELSQLREEGWAITIVEGYAWEDHFKMKGYVDHLEDLRINAPGGSKSAQGEMIKCIGNNSYGKTVEKLEGLELVLSADKPDGFSEYQCADDEIQHIWFRIGTPQVRDYHQPQIGTFITAQVRMVLRRAILTNVDDWLYADTDGVIFASKADKLDISPTRYGAWKIEEEGTGYRIITKKVYATIEAVLDEKTGQMVPIEKHSKGLNVKKLTENDFIKWFNGDAPSQKQIQRQNFLKVMTGTEMFSERIRSGSRKSTKLH